MSAETDSADEDLEGILDQVQSDPGLKPAEKQTTITFANDRDFASAFTEEPGLIRRFLQHPHIGVEELRILHDDDTVDYLPPEEWDGEAVVGVDARLPIGLLGIKGEPRKSKGHADVVTQSILDEPASGGGAFE